MQGKADLIDFMRNLGKDQFAALTIHHVVTHGKAGSANGTGKLTEGGSMEFCDVYEFTNAKGTSVKAISSYVIETG